MKTAFDMFREDFEKYRKKDFAEQVAKAKPFHESFLVGPSHVQNPKTTKMNRELGVHKINYYK